MSVYLATFSASALARAILVSPDSETLVNFSMRSGAAQDRSCLHQVLPDKHYRAGRRYSINPRPSSVPAAA
jgi:hypothetical protein